MGLLSSTPSLREGVLRCGKAITVTTEGAMDSDMTSERADRELLDQLRAQRDAVGRDMGYFTPHLEDAYISTRVSLSELDEEITRLELKLGLESQ